jgi:8-oxo-dGTP diphosphatase
MNDKTIVAKTFVINSNGLILTLRRSKTDIHRPLTWDLPGGGVEFGEDPVDAVIRETNEEAGIIINNPKIFNVTSKNDNGYVIRLLFYVYTDNENVKLSSEHDQFKWVTIDEYINLALPDYHKDAAKQLPI